MEGPPHTHNGFTAVGWSECDRAPRPRVHHLVSGPHSRWDLGLLSLPPQSVWLVLGTPAAPSMLVLCDTLTTAPLAPPTH